MNIAGEQLLPGYIVGEWALMGSCSNFSIRGSSLWGEGRVFREQPFTHEKTWQYPFFSKYQTSNSKIMSLKLGGFVPRTYFIGSFKSQNRALTYWRTVQMADESYLLHTSL